MSKEIKIAIADDHLFVRQGLIALLKEFPGIHILFDAGNGKEILEKVKTQVPDVLLLDIEMPVMDGADVFEKIKVKYPRLKVIIITSHYQDAYIVDYIKRGAYAFLSKNCGIEKIVAAITSVYEQGFYHDKAVELIMTKAICYSIDSAQPAPRSDLNLTDREILIIRLLCMNQSSSDIARQLFISVRTVEGHRLHIRQKTNCKNQMELTRFSIQKNLISI